MEPCNPFLLNLKPFLRRPHAKSLELLHISFCISHGRYENHVSAVDKPKFPGAAAAVHHA